MFNYEGKEQTVQALSKQNYRPINATFFVILVHAVSC